MNGNITLSQSYSEYERELLMRIIKASNPKDILNSLDERMFFSFTFRKIFRVVKKLFETTGVIDEIALIKEIKTDEVKELLTEAEFTTTANTKYYIKQVQDLYFQNLVNEAKTIEQMQAVQKEIDRWQDVSCMEHISINADKILCNYYDKWETAVKTGFTIIDDVIGSLQGGDFMIFAGATSSGKTMTALNIMMNMAKAGKKCNFYSQEMSKEQLINRIISQETGINSSKYRRFTLTADEQKKHLAYTEDELPKLPINICTDYKNLTVDKIANIEKKSDSEIVFIDYLGLLKSKSNGSQYEKITEISTDLKRVAMEVNKPFFVLHQLSRDLFSRNDKRPILSDLRGSGQLEQDADFVLFVHRPSYFDDTADPTDLQIIVAKNRHGETGTTLKFAYFSGQQKIREIKRMI